MNQETLTALVGSILKWDTIALGCGRDEAGNNCPLCVLSGKSSAISCMDCPIALKTGEDQCNQTPYWDIRNTLFERYSLPECTKDTEYHTMVALFANIEQFIEFMVDLLPEGFDHKNITYEYVAEQGKTQNEIPVMGMV